MVFFPVHLRHVLRLPVCFTSCAYSYEVDKIAFSILKTSLCVDCISDGFDRLVVVCGGVVPHMLPDQEWV